MGPAIHGGGRPPHQRPAGEPTPNRLFSILTLQTPRYPRYRYSGYRNLQSFDLQVLDKSSGSLDGILLLAS